jgi:hypothetical protein
LFSLIATDGNKFTVAREAFPIRNINEHKIWTDRYPGTYLISTLAGEPVMAATIRGTIKVNVVNVTDPNFAGVYTGDFSYDDTHLTKVGTEFMTINGGNGDRGDCYL